MTNTLIHENRRLQFPLDTLVDALIELESKQGHWPATATVVGASIDNSGGDNDGIILSIHRPEGGEVTERRYSLPMLAAAIVNYCVTVRVPIPRNSTKSIQLLADSVALVLENTVTVQSRHEDLSTLPAGSVRPTADTAPEKAVPPSGGAAPIGAASAGGATPPNETIPPHQAPPPSAATPSPEGPGTGSKPAG